MPKTSAGILAYRVRDERLEVFLVHPGGPFWRHKDLGAWTIPKGELEPGEDALGAARREFTEETGLTLPGPFVDLGQIRQAGGKQVHAFACAAEFEADQVLSQSLTVEWPPRSGKTVTFPEIDRAGWFPLEPAAQKINAAQVTLLTRLSDLVRPSGLPRPAATRPRPDAQR